MLAVQARSTECDEETPLPERARFVGELYALLTTETIPVALPVAVGVNEAVNVVLCPAGRVNDDDNPLIAKPAPVTVLPKICKSAGPELVNEAERELVLFTVMLPKSTVDGLSVSWDVTVPYGI